MANELIVTRVRVDYVVNGKSFMLEFSDPSSIDSIVFSTRDLERAQAMQAALAKVSASGVPPVTSNSFNPEMSASLSNGVAITSTGSPAAAVTAQPARSLWWHSSFCAWTHPDPD